MKILRFLSSFFKRKGTSPKNSIPTKKQVLSNQLIGNIKYFNKRKGYGFIETENIDQRIFVHITDLKLKAKVGNKVQFDLEENNKGYQAKNVKRYAQEDS